MVCLSSCTVCAQVVLLIVTPICAKYQSLYCKLLPLVEKVESALTLKRGDNFRQLLDHIRDSPEFCPLTLSIIFTEVESGVDRFVSRYVAANSINVYTVKANDLSLRGMWKDKINLTWVFFVNNLHDLNAIIYWQQELWKATNQYLIVLTNDQAAIPWRETFEILWKRYNVYRVIVATVRDDYRCLIKYLPFDLSGDGKFGGVHKFCLNEGTDGRANKKSSPDIGEEDTVSRLTNGATVFEKFQDLKGYPMNVIAFASLMMNISQDANRQVKFSRVDADVMALLEKAMRMKFRVQVIQGPLYNDPFHRALSYVDRGTAELIITGFFIKNYENHRKYEFTAAVYNDKLCFIAPAAGLIPKSYMPFMPFEKEVWFLLVLYNILITILWYLISHVSVSFRDQRRILLPLTSEAHFEAARKTGKGSSRRMLQGLNRLPEDRSGSRFSSSFQLRRGKTSGPVGCLDSMVKGLPLSMKINPPEIHPQVMACFDLLETSCYPVQGGETSAQRAFLFGTLFFGLIVTGVYHSCLVSSLSKPSHYRELNSLEDVLNSNKTIVTKYPNLKATFIDNSLLGRRLLEKIQIVSSDKPTNHLVAYTRQAIALGRYSSLKLENLTMYYDKEGNNLLHIVEECPATYMVSYIVRLYSPYRERINWILLRMREAGLIGLWYKNVIYPMEVEARKREDAASERKIKLTLEHYSLTFLGLFIGLLCCTLVFLGEIYFAKRLSLRAETGRV